MNKNLENYGWNSCLHYLLEHLEDFHNNLRGGQYDYFPYDEIENALKSLIKGEQIC